MIFKLYIGSGLGPEGAIALAPALREMTNLEYLFLGGKLL
jgi:hypothetical protein